MQLRDVGFAAARVGMDAYTVRMQYQQAHQLGATKAAGAENMRFESDRTVGGARLRHGLSTRAGRP